MLWQYRRAGGIPTSRRPKNRRVISENQNDSQSRGAVLHHLRPAGTICESFSSTEMIIMIDLETHARIRRLFYAEHWKIGTIARELGLHHDTVSRAVGTDRFNSTKTLRPSATDPYADFIREILVKHPRLRATRIYQMIRDRGYTGSIVQLRRFVACVRPTQKEVFLRLRTFPGEEGQVDWANFGEVSIGRARRRLSCFVITLSYSRALYLEFFFDQRMESFLRGHIHAFEDWQGLPRILAYDNLRSVVLERRGDNIHFHPRILELCAHYHFAPRPCQVGAGNQKGRVERAIRYIRESFFAARPFTTLEDFNRQALQWRDREAHKRLWPGGDHRTVEEAFMEEKPRLLPLPAHLFDSDLLIPIKPGKTIYVRFDLNDYSIPPDALDRRKQLMLAASGSTIRILDGNQEIARHRRSYDRRQQILNPDHQEALLKEKRKALGSTRGSRLSEAVPESEALLDAAFARGQSAGRQTTQLLNLLDLYGARELRDAICEALDRKTPRASSVAFILNQRRRFKKRQTPSPVDLSRYPELEHLSVTPHNLETYDDLAKDDDTEK
jgi:transposase